MRWHLTVAGLLLAVMTVAAAESRGQTARGATPASAPADATLSPSGSVEIIPINFGGYSRQYVLHQPFGYRGSGRLPLVIFLHGAGGSAGGASLAYGWRTQSNRERFFVAFAEALPAFPSLQPDFTKNPRFWNDGSGRGTAIHNAIDDVGYLGAVLDDIERRCPIDPDRVYISGFSSGASMTCRAGVELSARLAAIAPVSGHLELTNPRPAHPISMMLITGLADPLNPFDGGMARNPWGPDSVKPPMTQTALDWSKLIGAGDVPQVLSDADGIKSERFGPGPSGQVVILTTVANLGHEWPGYPRVLPVAISGPTRLTPNATELVWEFFKTQVRGGK